MVFSCITLELLFALTKGNICPIYMFFSIPSLEIVQVSVRFKVNVNSSINTHFRDGCMTSLKASFLYVTTVNYAYVMCAETTTSTLERKPM